MEEQEIVLHDYIKVLLKWKKLIILLTLIPTFISGILSYVVLKPIYKGEAFIEMPQVAASTIPLSISLQDAQQLIKSDSFIGLIAEGMGVSLQEIKQGLIVSTSQSKYLLVSLELQDKNKIRGFFNCLLGCISESEGSDYENYIESLKHKIALFTDNLEKLKNSEKLILEKLQKTTETEAMKQEYYLEYVVLESLYTSITNQISVLEQQILDLKTQIELSHNYRYIGEPVILDTPLKPNKISNMVIAGVAGFFFSVFLALLLDYWHGRIDKEGNK